MTSPCCSIIVRFCIVLDNILILWLLLVGNIYLFPMEWNFVSDFCDRCQINQTTINCIEFLQSGAKILHGTRKAFIRKHGNIFQKSYNYVVKVEIPHSLLFVNESGSSSIVFLCFFTSSTLLPLCTFSVIDGSVVTAPKRYACLHQRDTISLCYFKLF